MTSKAYFVTDEEGGTIVFAKSGIAARRLGAGELDIEFSEVHSCRRFPEADQFLGKNSIPDAFLFDRDWTIPCHCCWDMVEKSNEGTIVDGEHVYCSEICAHSPPKQEISA